MSSFFDTSVRRESACPVHFVWDGNGFGRPVVRVGFLLLLASCLTTAAGQISKCAVVFDIGKGALAAALVVWLVGQGLTRLSRARARTHTAPTSAP